MGVLKIWDPTVADWVELAPPAQALVDLTDVNAPAPADGDALVWDDGAGEWVAAAPAAVPSTLDALTDVNAPAPSDGQALVWDATPGEWVAATPAGGGGAGNVAGTWATSDPGAPASPEAIWYDTDAVALPAPSGASGTAFPVSPTSGVRFYRSDIGMWFRYNGMLWLCECLHVLVPAPTAGAGAGSSASVTEMYVAHPGLGLGPGGTHLSMWVERLNFTWYVAVAHSASHYWTFTLSGVGSCVTDKATLGANRFTTTAVGVAVAPGTSGTLDFRYTETGTTQLFGGGSCVFRFIGV